MNSLKEGLKNVWKKFKGLDKKVKIALIITLATFFIAIISMLFYSSANKYKILFSGLDPYDAQVVTQKLNEQKVDVKIEGDTILVPKEQVDELRLSLAPDLSNGSKGYELMDTGNSFGMTDEEFKLKKLRMLQGELEKTIKSFPQVGDARVHITAAKDSVFVTDKEPGKAAVYLKVNPGNRIDKEQVKSIIALVSGSTDNIPKENIEVIDDKMNLLSENLNDEDANFASAETIQTQLTLEKQYEQSLEQSIVELLTPIMGKNKVKAAVNADLDFDSKEKTQTIIDPNKVAISEHIIKEENTDNSTGSSGGPIDENMGNTMDSENGNSSSSREEGTTNYEVGRKEEKTISAPGEVRTLNASVIVDGNLEPNLQTAIENAVATAIGFKAERGDKVSVVGIAFDPTIKEENNLTNPFAEKNSNNNLLTYLALAIGGLLIGALIVTIFIRRKKNNKGEKRETLLDVVIEDKIEKIKEEPLAPIEFEVPNEQMHLEQEIRKYASEKPEQVVDIIKSWLAESER